MWHLWVKCLKLETNFLFSLLYSCRGSNLLSMRTGERHWLVRALQYFAFWTSMVTASLCWKACQTISHLDRLVEKFVWQCTALFSLNSVSTFLQSCCLILGFFCSVLWDCKTISYFTGILGSRWHRCGVCWLVAWAFQTWPKVLPKQEVVTFSILNNKSCLIRNVFIPLLQVIHISVSFS